MADFKLGKRGNLVTDRDSLHASDGYARQVAALQELKDGKNMTDKTMTLEGGKYTLIMRDDGGMDALRNGSRWRDLTGDKLILALVQRIDELESKPAERGEAVVVEAVGRVRRGKEGNDIEWLVEGGIAEMMEGDYLLCASRDITNDEGYGEVYTAPPPAAGVPKRMAKPMLGPDQDACDGFVHECGYADGWNACRAAMLSATPSPTIDVAAVREAIDPRILAAFKAIGEWAGPNLTASIARSIGDAK